MLSTVYSLLRFEPATQNLNPARPKKCPISPLSISGLFRLIPAFPFYRGTRVKMSQSQPVNFANYRKLHTPPPPIEFELEPRSSFGTAKSRSTSAKTDPPQADL